MDLFADRTHGTPVSVVGEHDRVTEIWLFVGSFGVDSNQVEFLPDHLEESVEVEFHVAADDDGVGQFGIHVDFLHGDGVNFVVAVQTLDVLPVP